MAEIAGSSKDRKEESNTSEGARDSGFPNETYTTDAEFNITPEMEQNITKRPKKVIHPQTIDEEFFDSNLFEEESQGDQSEAEAKEKPMQPDPSQQVNEVNEAFDARPPNPNQRTTEQNSEVAPAWARALFQQFAEMDKKLNQYLDRTTTLEWQVRSERSENLKRYTKLDKRSRDVKERLAEIDARELAAEEALSQRISRQENAVNRVETTLQEIRKDIRDLETRPTQNERPATQDQTTETQRTGVPKVDMTQTAPQAVPSAQIHTLTQVIRTDGDLKPPFFDPARKDRPFKYLRDLRHYVEAKNIRNMSQIKAAINTGLKTGASIWWDSVEEDVLTLDQFEVAFKRRFWSAEVQRTIKRQWEWGRYNPTSDGSKVDYATKMFNAARDLDIPTESIIQGIGRHFDWGTSNAINCWNFQTLQQLTEFLERQDMAPRRVNNAYQSNQNTGASGGGQITNRNANQNGNSGVSQTDARNLRTGNGNAQSNNSRFSNNNQWRSSGGQYNRNGGNAGSNNYHNNYNGNGNNRNTGSAGENNTRTNDNTNFRNSNYNNNNSNSGESNFRGRGNNGQQNNGNQQRNQQNVKVATTQQGPLETQEERQQEN